jgi:hypothetical protein
MEHNVKSIPGFEGYFADKTGNIYSQWSNHGISLDKMHKLKPAKYSNGYLFVNLRIAKYTYFSTGVHRLVCLAFYGPPVDKNFTASHIDGDRTNNKLENLIWESQSDNLKRKFLHGTHDRGYNNSRAKITKEQLNEIRILLEEKKLTHKQIGKKFNVNRVFVTKINNGYRYKDL